MTKYLRYANLVEDGLVNNRATLKNLIDKCGFPPGRLVGPKTRRLDLTRRSTPTSPAALSRPRRPRPRLADAPAKPTPPMWHKVMATTSAALRTRCREPKCHCARPVPRHITNG